MPWQPKIYPNLNPAAAIPVDRTQIFHLKSFFDRFRLLRSKHHGHYVPNAKYVFVRMSTGELLAHPTFRHPVLAEGRPVQYAGEACFENGRLLWWSNGSGNYRPDPEHAGQADLPMDRFFSHDEVLKGLHQQPASQQYPREASTLQLQRSPARPLILWPPAYPASQNSRARQR